MAEGDRPLSAPACLARPAAAKQAVADEKPYLRAVLSEARSGLSAERAGALSAQVQRRMLATPEYRASAKVVLYAPVGGEVDTALIAADALRTHRQLYYPIIDRGLRRLRLGPVANLGELRAGAFGIPQPPAIGAFEPGALTSGPGAALVCVPGVAFTPAGARLGRGGGYYDRLLAELPREARAAGLGYSFQLIDWLPEESHDRRLDFIVTESAVYAASATPPAATQTADRGGSHRWAC
jgi:5-formyltetrahydrofolate cyclo-ligase